MHTQKSIEDLSRIVIGCIIEVHRNLGPGLLESVYHTCLVKELKESGLSVQDKPYVPVIYKGEDLGGKLQMDILVNDVLILELKAVEVMIPIFKAQLKSYLKLSGKPKGLLINFNCEMIKHQISSIVTPAFFKLPKI